MFLNTALVGILLNQRLSGGWLCVNVFVSVCLFSFMLTGKTYHYIMFVFVCVCLCAEIHIGHSVFSQCSIDSHMFCFVCKFATYEQM